MLDCSSTPRSRQHAKVSESFSSPFQMVLPVSDRLKPCAEECMGWEQSPSDTLYRQMVAPLKDNQLMRGSMQACWHMVRLA